MGQAGEEVLREHWEGDGDILAQIQRVIDSAESVLNSRVVRSLRRRFQTIEKSAKG